MQYSIVHSIPLCSNRLASDTVKLVDFDGVGNAIYIKRKMQQKIKVSDEHLYQINISPTLLFSRFMYLCLTFFVK